MRILLAEDNRTLADWLEKALSQGGFAVDCMHDGIEADHVLLTQEYDLVILGNTAQALQMPADGRLFLGVNDDHPADNSGNLVVKVWQP